MSPQCSLREEFGWNLRISYLDPRNPRLGAFEVCTDALDGHALSRRAVEPNHTWACSADAAMELAICRSLLSLPSDGRRAMSDEPVLPCLEIRSISASDTQELRRRVLRPDLTSVPYRGDQLPDTAHFGAFLGDRLVGVASAFREPLVPPGGLPSSPLAEAAASPASSWRIRGVAVDASLRGKGYGSKLIDACIRYSSHSGGTCVWCVARCSAEIVYERLGFRRVGELFHLDGIGPVRYMVKQCVPNSD